MIRPLRRIHLRFWIALAVLLPLFFASSLLVRRTTTPLNPGLQWEKFR
jgi:hypothetical protein